MGLRAPAALDRAFVPVASVAAGALSFGVADVAGGSGFLAVYLVGLAVGSTPSRHRRQLVAFHEGLAYLAQVTMFIVLGLLVFPRDLPDVALAGLALAGLLMIVIRPVAVVISTAFSRFTARERALLGWAGLRGAVPIVLATFVLSSDVDDAETIFNAVFFVVVVSALVQGTTLEWVAKRLGLVDPGRRCGQRLSRWTRSARSSSWSSTSPGITPSRARSCASSGCRAARLLLSSRGAETRSRREAGR
jgi:potassium/hydrogen antiporter